MFYFILFFLFILWMTFRLKTLAHKQKHDSYVFWQKENEANQTKRQSLDTLTYIRIPLEQLPFLDTEDAQILQHQNTIKTLAQKEIVNLTGLTNTELKLKYGAPNITILSEYDQNFTSLLRELFLWGQTLNKKGFRSEAITVLEFGITCRTDIRGHYTLLARLYKEVSDFANIEALIKTAETHFTGIMKPATLKTLNEIWESCHTPE